MAASTPLSPDGVHTFRARFLRVLPRLRPALAIDRPRDALRQAASPGPLYVETS
jgi:hypothetical protein